MGKRLLRPEEAATFLGVSKWTIYRWIEDGRIKATKIGPGCLRIFPESIESLIEINMVSASASPTLAAVDAERGEILSHP